MKPEEQVMIYRWQTEFKLHPDSYEVRKRRTHQHIELSKHKVEASDVKCIIMPGTQAYAVLTWERDQV